MSSFSSHPLGLGLPPILGSFLLQCTSLLAFPALTSTNWGPTSRPVHPFNVSLIGKGHPKLEWDDKSLLPPFRLPGKTLVTDLKEADAASEAFLPQLTR